MVNETLRKNIKEQYGDVILFYNQDYDNSIIGFIDSDDGEHVRAVYSRSKMETELADEYMESGDYESYDDAMTSAIEWIDYNTMRAIGYCKTDVLLSPIVVDDTMMDWIKE